MHGGSYHHIYLPPSDRLLFSGSATYQQFLSNYAQAVDDVAETLAYCLLPDHFHFLIYVQNPDSFEQRMRLLFTHIEIRQPIQRPAVRQRELLRLLIRYIHTNPTHHDRAERFQQWRWSSYRAVLGAGESRVAVRRVRDLFHGVRWFEESHWSPLDTTQITHLIVDD